MIARSPLVWSSPIRRCLLAGWVVGTVVVTACGQNRPAAPNEAASAAVTPGMAIPVQIEVEVYPDRLDPEQLVLRAGEAVRVEVVDHSGAVCSFYVGEYLRDLEVPSGGHAEMAFTVPNLPGPPGAVASTTTFGCKGDAARTGNVVVQPRPSA